MRKEPPSASLPATNVPHLRLAINKDTITAIDEKHAAVEDAKFQHMQQLIDNVSPIRSSTPTVSAQTPSYTQTPPAVVRVSINDLLAQKPTTATAAAQTTNRAVSAVSHDSIHTTEDVQDMKRPMHNIYTRKSPHRSVAELENEWHVLNELADVELKRRGIHSIDDTDPSIDSPPREAVKPAARSQSYIPKAINEKSLASRTLDLPIRIQERRRASHVDTHRYPRQIFNLKSPGRVDANDFASPVVQHTTPQSEYNIPKRGRSDDDVSLLSTTSASRYAFSPLRSRVISGQSTEDFDINLSVLSQNWRQTNSYAEKHDVKRVYSHLQQEQNFKALVEREHRNSTPPRQLIPSKRSSNQPESQSDRYQRSRSQLHQRNPTNRVSQTNTESRSRSASKIPQHSSRREGDPSPTLQQQKPQPKKTTAKPSVQVQRQQDDGTPRFKSPEFQRRVQRMQEIAMAKQQKQRQQPSSHRNSTPQQASLPQTSLNEYVEAVLQSSAGDVVHQAALLAPLLSKNNNQRVQLATTIGSIMLAKLEETLRESERNK